MDTATPPPIAETSPLTVGLATACFVLGVVSLTTFGLLLFAVLATIDLDSDWSIAGLALCILILWSFGLKFLLRVAHEPKTSGLATTSLVLGLVSVCMPFGFILFRIIFWNFFFTLPNLVTGLSLCTWALGAIFAPVFGIVAIKRISKSAGQLDGKGRAITGICTGLLALIILMVVPFFVKTSEKVSCYLMSH